MRKTSRHIVDATETGLERMTTYVSSISKRMQIGDFIFPEEKVPQYVKKQESYKKIINLFNELSEAIKSELKKEEEGVNKLEAKAKEKLHVEAEKRGGRINQELQHEEKHRNERILQKETKELEASKKDSDTEKNKDRNLLKEKPERIEEKQTRGNETAEETQADKTKELPEVTVKEKLEEETQRRTERTNQELQEVLIETKRLLHDRTEELRNVKDVLEELLKERAGKAKEKQRLENGAAEEYEKIQASIIQKLMEVKEEEGGFEAKNRQLQAEEKQNLPEKTKDLHNAEASEKQWLKNEKAEKMEEKQKYETETAEESRKNQTRSLEKSRSHQTKTWLIEHTLNEDKSRILREKMTQLYDETCKDLETDIFKLLDRLHYNEIKKHEIFRNNVASKMKIINQFSGEGNEAVDAEYKKLISLLEEERVRLQKLLNSPASHEDPYVRSTLKKLEDIMNNTKELEDEVNKFQGDKRDIKFLDLEHKLFHNVMKLDIIQTMGYNEIRKKKLEVIEYATNCMEKLDANVIEGV